MCRQDINASVGDPALNDGPSALLMPLSRTNSVSSVSHPDSAVGRVRRASVQISPDPDSAVGRVRRLESIVDTPGVPRRRGSGVPTTEIRAELPNPFGASRRPSMVDGGAPPNRDPTDHQPDDTLPTLLRTLSGSDTPGPSLRRGSVHADEAQDPSWFFGAALPSPFGTSRRPSVVSIDNEPAQDSARA